MRVSKALFLGFALIVGLSGCNYQTPIMLENGEQGKLVQFDSKGLSKFTYGPLIAGVEVLKGEPKFNVVTVDKRDRVKAVFWESTQGKWHFSNSKNHWEYCHITQGVSVVTEDGGKPQRYVEGQSFILHPGFSGTWEVIEPTRKEFVIVTVQQ